MATCDPVTLALQAAKDAALDTLRETCTVTGQGATKTATAYGYSYAETTASYPCSILAHQSEREFIAGDKVVSTYDTTILLPLSASVAPQDFITQGSRRYEVVATDEGRSGALVIAVAARKVVA